MNNWRSLGAAFAALSLLSSTSFALPGANLRFDEGDPVAQVQNDSQAGISFVNWGGHGGMSHPAFPGGVRGGEGRVFRPGPGADHRAFFGEHYRFVRSGPYFRFAPWGIAATVFGVAVAFGVWESWGAANRAACVEHYTSVYYANNAACQDPYYCSPPTGCYTNACLYTAGVEFQAHAWHNCGAWLNVNIPSAWATMTPPPPPDDMPAAMPSQAPAGAPQYNITIQPAQ